LGLDSLGVEDDPEEPGEFSGDGDDRLLGRLTSESETDVASVESLVRAGGEFFIEVMEPLLELIEREEIAVEGRPARGVVEVEGVKPREGTGSPRPLGPGEEAGTTEKELAHAVTGAGEILPHVLAAATEIPESFFALGGRVHLGEEVGAEELDELPGVAPIGPAS
jgi:hypothetical protein